MPASWAPASTDDHRDGGVDLNRVLVEDRLDHPVLELLVDEEQDQPDRSARRGSRAAPATTATSSAADREPDQRHEVEEGDQDRERHRELDPEQLERRAR